MIQRIQTLFLLLAIGLLVMMIFMPTASIDVYNGGSEILEKLKILPFATGSEAQASITAVAMTRYIALLLTLALIVAFVAISSFKNRLLQIRMCFVNLVLLVGTQVFVGYSLYRTVSFIEQMNSAVENYTTGVNYSIVAVFPTLVAILTFLALRAITKDEMLVRSLDRIR